MEDTTSFEKSQISYRASSEGPSPPPRSAREDGDASKTRKRPRLDSGDRTYRSLSAGPTSTQSTLDTLHVIRSSLEKEESQDNLMAQEQVITSPPSKVTLNIKEQSTSSSIEGSARSHTTMEIQDSQETDNIIAPPTPPPRTPSPLGSPEIEVAEPEDARGYYGPTIWKRPGTKNVEDLRQDLVENFSLLQDTDDWRNAATKIAFTMQWEDNDIAPTLNTLSDFMNQWISLADMCPNTIWELWSPDSDLWVNFPIINDGILKRNHAATILRSTPGNHSNEIDLTEEDIETSAALDKNDSDPIFRLYKAIVGILVRLLHMDRQTLIETSGDAAEPELGAKPFIYIFSMYCIGTFENNCHDILWRMYSGGRWKPTDLLNELTTDFINLQGVEKLYDCTISLVERSPTDLEYATNCISVAAGVLYWCCNGGKSHSTIVRHIYNTLSRLYSRCTERFEDLIKKQASGFTIEVIQRYMSALFHCLKHLCVIDYKQSMKLLPPGFDQGLSKYIPEIELEGELASELLALKVRLEMTFLCTKNGRMESRVAGVEAFSDLLLTVFRRHYEQHRDPENLHPIVSLCQDFIRQKDLISYLVGVDSHPQVIIRSKNIIGFQVVTHCYSQRDTDTIWTSMRFCQDPRQSEAIMDVLVAQVEYAEISFLQSFAEKLGELPIEAYDQKMRLFVNKLLIAAVKKKPLGQSLVESICSNVLIPILRDCLKHEGMSVKQKKDLWLSTANELRTVLGNELSTRAKSQISEMAVKTIEEANYASTAGITILVILIDARYLGFDYNGKPYCTTDEFASLIVDDLGRCSEILKQTNLDGENIGEILRPRLELIEKCLQVFPSWPSEKHMERLWQNLVGDGAFNERARDFAYRTLARLARSINIERKAFLDSCLLTYFETLDSHHITPFILEFAREGSAYFERLVRSDYNLSRTLQPLPGDMFWHIALKADNHDIVEKSTNYFVEYSLAVTLNIPTSIFEENHVRVVDRCVHQLTIAANKIKSHLKELNAAGDESKVVDATNLDAQLAKKQFSRALYVLKLFLTKIREKRLGSPIVRNDSPLSSHSVHGEEITFTFFHPHNARQGKLSLIIGTESTLKDLVVRLCSATGFSKIRIYAGGQPVNQERDADSLLKDIPILCQTQHLLIQKFPGSQMLKEPKIGNRMLPLEQQVMVHFDKIYELLDLNDEMGREVCNFLMTFPAKEEILVNRSSELLPLDSPYKSIYCIYVLKKKLLRGLSEGVSCENDLLTIVNGVGNALIQLAMSRTDYFTPPLDVLLIHMTDCLQLALKEAVSDEVAVQYFPDVEIFINSIIKILEAALGEESTKDRSTIIQCCFSIVLEAALKIEAAWKTLKAHPNVHDILKASWLASDTAVLRSNTTQIVKGICAAFPLLESFDSTDFVEFFWNQILALIPSVQDYPDQSRQFFDLAMTIFRSASERMTSDMPIDEYIRSWSTLLLNHEPQESSPFRDVDDMVDGLTDMLIWSLQLAKSKKQPIEGTKELMQRIFIRHAFPMYQEHRDVGNPKARVPVLSSATRAKLYTLITSLTTDQVSLQVLVRLLREVVPPHEDKNGSWSNGVARLLEDDADPSWMIERDKIVRADTGYAGLRNLSNTCYLNSLFMQLFMNVRFRDFMLHATTYNPHTEVLVHETQRLFAYLQSTWLKCVDPSNVVENIITFDGEPIDVHIQMDVDEFYNLLFDRWENQLVDEEDKKQFRRFYGGELVQQIKSQDCSHVSERIEPFSVIQCDIQGKSGLVESLNAFIEGEMMQGDNKYKCSSCDAYVNAVKRACLKNVPDNLIFHLKRFDYDLVNGTRHKINDQFEFPMEIDMAPYNIEYLQNPRSSPTPDKFMLVGILVHSGTAEIGHYYSFIRERPGLKSTWVEMNDSEVSSFDPATIPHHCYGGWDQSVNPAWMKSYNAYMLFYQRIDSMMEDAITFPTKINQPVETKIPKEMASQLVSENELWIRKYCLLDPSYVKFSRDLLDKYRDLYQEQCSDTHGIEFWLIEGTVYQIELFFARLKDCKYLDELLRSLARIIRRCSHCAAYFIKTITNDGTFRSLLFRCPQEIIKQRLADEVFHALNLLRDQDPQLYDSNLSSPDSLSSRSNNSTSSGAFYDVLNACDNIVDTIPLLAKGWDDFWSFMCRLAGRGRWELSQVHERSYFLKALQIFGYHGDLNQQNEWTFANLYWKLRTRKRYAMANVASLVVMVFRGYIETNNDLDAEDKFERVQFTDIEHRILQHNTTPPEFKTRAVHNIVLSGFLHCDGFDTGLYENIMQCFLTYGQDTNWFRSYAAALSLGSTINPASLAAPFLIAALVFVEHCPDDRSIIYVINKYAEGVGTIGDEGGFEHLQFFNRLRFIHNRNFHGPRAGLLKRTLISRLYLLLPSLLCYHDGDVRKGATNLGNALVLGVDLEIMDDEEEAHQLLKWGRELTASCVNKLQTLVDAKKLYDIRRLDELIDVIKIGLEKYRDDDNEDSADRLLQERYTRCLEVIPQIAEASPDIAESAEYSDSDELTDVSIVQT